MCNIYKKKTYDKKIYRSLHIVFPLKPQHNN